MKFEIEIIKEETILASRSLTHYKISFRRIIPFLTWLNGWGFYNEFSNGIYKVKLFQTEEEALAFSRKYNPVYHNDVEYTKMKEYNKKKIFTTEF